MLFVEPRIIIFLSEDQVKAHCTMEFIKQRTSFLSVFLLFISALDAVTITTIVNGNNALTQLALNMDEPLVALTPQSGIVAAKVLTSLHFSIS